MIRIVLLVALVLVPGLVHAGTSDFIGKWKLVAVKTADGPVPKDKLAGGGVIWDFKADGSLAITVWQGKRSVTSDAKWTVEGNLITVDESGQLNQVTYARKGAKLELAGTGNSTVVMTLEKTK